MKAVRLLGVMLVAALGVFFAAGCGRSSDGEGAYEVYYLNKEGTKIVPVSCGFSAGPDSSQEDKIGRAHV